MHEDKDNISQTELCQSMNWRREYEWFGRVGYSNLSGNRLAKIELVTRGTAHVYAGFMVTILDVHNGKIDQTYHGFSDYNLPAINQRVWGWAFKPRKEQEVITAPFCEAVEKYISLFE